MVLCHGDPHPGNLLSVSSPRPGAPTGYVWVDPDGFLCEPEYDLGVVLRGFNDLILAADDPVVTLRSWCAVLAEATGTDAEAIWQWAYLERVTSGLYLINQGWPERGRRFLDSASWVIARKTLTGRLRARSRGRGPRGRRWCGPGRRSGGRCCPGAP